MPTVLDKPQVLETRPPALKPEPPPLRPIRSRRWLRWTGWLLAAGALAIVLVVAINVASDDTTDVPTAIDLPDTAITADPKPRTPVTATPSPDIGAPLGFGTEATVTPPSHTRLVKQAPAGIPDLLTGYMGEATVTPGLVDIGVPVKVFWRTLAEVEMHLPNERPDFL